MNTELPEGWTLSEPTPMMHGEWFRTYFDGMEIHSLVLIRTTDGKWWPQGWDSLIDMFDSARDAINAATEAAGITMD